MLQHHASAEENTEKKSVDPQEVITNAESQAQPVAQSKAPTMDNFVFVSPGFLKLHGKGKINRRMYYITNEEKQLACITDNAGDTVTPLAHPSLHALKEGMKQAKLPFKYRIVMFERGHLSMLPTSSKLWRELYVAQYIKRHECDTKE